MNTTPVNFENINIRRVYDEKTETWNFSVVDIIRAFEVSCYRNTGTG